MKLLYTRKEMEREVDKALYEDSKRRERFEEISQIHKRIDEVMAHIWALESKCGLAVKDDEATTSECAQTNRW